MISIGEISEINRYPVKSFAGESLETGIIDSYGLYGDRSHAFIDETKEGWSSYFTARQIPMMLSYKAELIGEGSPHSFPKVKITSPQGLVLNWDEQLIKELQPYAKSKMTMITRKPDSTDLPAFDEGSILIITDNSLRKLEALWGTRLDKRRFRANLVVTLKESSLSENDWLGKRLVIGSSTLKADNYCQRCSMITIHPETLKPAPDLLKKVTGEMNSNFGIYASVIKTGQIHIGDKVYLTD